MSSISREVLKAETKLNNLAKRKAKAIADAPEKARARHDGILDTYLRGLPETTVNALIALGVLQEKASASPAGEVE